jgi:hypothetical protein
MFLDNGYRSKCCYAPLRLGKKKIKNSNTKINIWICTKCKTKGVDIMQYTKNLVATSNSDELDTPDSDVLE